MTLTLVVVGVYAYLALWASIARATGTRVSWWSALIVYLGCAFAAFFGSGHSERGRISDERLEFLAATFGWLLLMSPLAWYFYPAVQSALAIVSVVAAMGIANYILDGRNSKSEGHTAFVVLVMVLVAFTRVLALISPRWPYFYNLWTGLWVLAAMMNFFGPWIQHLWHLRQIDQDVKRAQGHLKRTNAA